MGGRNDLLVVADGCADRGGRVVLVGIAIMDPIIMIAALIIIAVEMYIRLL
jgi:hypothetical protein